MERFDKFFLPGRPFLDKIVVSINPDPSSMLLALERGDLLMTGFISTPTDLQRLSKDPRLDVTAKGYEGIGSINWLAFNLTKKPLSDLAVRKAIATAIDKKFILKALMGGYSFAADGPIASSSPFATQDVVRYPFDLKKAAAMLDAAGYKADANGERFKVTIDYYPGADTQQKEPGRIHAGAVEERSASWWRYGPRRTSPPGPSAWRRTISTCRWTRASTGAIR